MAVAKFFTVATSLLLSVWERTRHVLSAAGTSGNTTNSKVYDALASGHDTLAF